MSSVPNPKTSRDHRIDVLRGISIFLVLLHHFHLAYQLGPGLLYRNGNYGVTIFFVISGFLITSTSLRRFGSLDRIRLRSFYVYRFARIYPCLLLVLTAITLPGLAGIHYFASNKPVPFLLADLSVLTFSHNILMAHTGYFNYGINTFWSLSVEEMFYLAFPLLCVLLKRNWLIASVGVAAILYAPWYRSRHASDEIQFLYANFSCFDAIAIGCGTALLAANSKVSSPVRTMLQMCAAAAMAAIYFHSGIWANVTWGPTLMALSAGLYLWAEGSSPSLPVSRFEPVGWLGRRSYELYLFHIVILAVLRNLYDRGSVPAALKWPWFALFVALSVVIAALVARLYSDPLNQAIRKRFA